jgi:hypothetical protein
MIEISKAGCPKHIAGPLSGQYSFRQSIFSIPNITGKLGLLQEMVFWNIAGQRRFFA